jgi:hypothetical protein
MWQKRSVFKAHTCSDQFPSISLNFSLAIIWQLVDKRIERSLALGAATVPRLVAQAAWSSWQQRQRQRAQERHFQERFDSGAALDADDMAPGGGDGSTSVGGSELSNTSTAASATATAPHAGNLIEMHMLSGTADSSSA